MAVFQNRTILGVARITHQIRNANFLRHFTHWLDRITVRASLEALLEARLTIRVGSIRHYVMAVEVIMAVKAFLEILSKATSTDTGLSSIAQFYFFGIPFLMELTTRITFGVVR